jgi:hypothetical protein
MRVMVIVRRVQARNHDINNEGAPTSSAKYRLDLFLEIRQFPHNPTIA